MLPKLLSRPSRADLAASEARLAALRLGRWTPDPDPERVETDGSGGADAGGESNAGTAVAEPPRPASASGGVAGSDGPASAPVPVPGGAASGTEPASAVGRGPIPGLAARMWQHLPGGPENTGDPGDTGDPDDTGDPGDPGSSDDTGRTRVAARSSAGRLPESLRRLADLRPAVRADPGRRAALAVIALAVVAVTVTAVLVWRSRPAVEPVRSLGAAAVAEPSGSRAVDAGPSADSGAGSVAPTGPGATASGSAPAPSAVIVAVAGKVRHPGLVQLPAGARVADAIAAAGGLRPGARIGLLNIAQVVSDGEQVVVGVPGHTGTTGGATGAASSSGPIRLNTATAEQLERLPGIGQVTAQRIIDYRTQHGPFRTVQALQDVPGIGPVRCAAIAAKVTL